MFEPVSLQGINLTKRGAVATGVAELDAMIEGLQPGDLILLASRPSMGRSVLAGDIAISVSTTFSSPVLYVNSRSSATRLAENLVFRHSQGVRCDDMAAPCGQEPATAKAPSSELEPPSIFLKSSGLTEISAIQRSARYLEYEQGGLGLIVIDDIESIVTDEFACSPREVVKAACCLKDLALECDVPVLAGFTLSNRLEQRADKRPRFEDFGEFSGLCRIADMIIFLYRDDFYDLASPCKGTVEVSIAKNINGATGVCSVSRAW